MNGQDDDEAASWREGEGATLGELKDVPSGEENEAVEKYLRNCKKYEVAVDPSIVISLKTAWHILAPTKLFCEGSMLPLAGILEGNRHIKKVVLRGAGMNNRKPEAGNGNSNARILHQILRSNDSVVDLNLSNTGLDDDGVTEVAAALKENSHLTALNLSDNLFGVAGCRELVDALNHNERLQELDVSRNKLGFGSVSSLRTGANGHASRRGCCSCRVRVDGNYVFEEILNALSHGVGFIASVVGGILLMSAASAPGKSEYHFWSCALFTASLLFLYLSSTLFHSFFMLPRVYIVLQLMDHCGIYLLIAGSYSPFLMIELHHVHSAQVVIIAQWVAAIAGCIFTISTPKNTASSAYIEVAMYLAMGLSIVCVWSEAVEHFQPVTLNLIVAGGASYIFGILFFVAGEFIPIYHCVWHVFVMVASALHWCAIYFYVVQKDLVDCVAPPSLEHVHT